MTSTASQQVRSPWMRCVGCPGLKELTPLKSTPERRHITSLQTTLPWWRTGSESFRWGRTSFCYKVLKFTVQHRRWYMYGKFLCYSISGLLICINNIILQFFWYNLMKYVKDLWNYTVYQNHKCRKAIVICEHLPFQNVLRRNATKLLLSKEDNKPTLQGWLTKVKHGHARRCWCVLIGKMFIYFKNPNDQVSIRQ